MLAGLAGGGAALGGVGDGVGAEGSEADRSASSACQVKGEGKNLGKL